MSGLARSTTPRLRAGAIAAIATLVLDQASKLWLLYVFDIAHRGAVRVTPFFDLVLAWNVGISFGWFQTDNQFAQVALIAIKAIAVIVLGVWMARSSTLLATVALGLIIGARSVTASIASSTARWSILPCSTSISAEKPSIGTCLTLRMWPLLPG